MFKTNTFKTKLALVSAFAVTLSAMAVYCGQLRIKSGNASADFFHYESGDPTGEDIRTCECWFISDVPRTVRCYAQYKDRYGVWHNKVGTPFTLTNTTSAMITSEGFYPCDGVYAIKAWIQEGTLTRAVSDWY